MGMKAYPVIDLVATGDNIRRLRLERGLTVRDLQSYFGFEEPRAIYKWQKGESLPTVDNLYALGNLFEVPMDQILVPVAVKLHIIGEQQAESCCSSHIKTGYPRFPVVPFCFYVAGNARGTHFVVAVDAEEYRPRIVEKGLYQVISASFIIVRSDIPEEDDHVLHCGMYFIDEVRDAVDGAVNVTCEVDHHSSPFRTFLPHIIILMCS